METSVTHKLKAARALITPREKWCQGSQRKIIKGVAAHCAFGALQYSEGGYDKRSVAFLNEAIPDGADCRYDGSTKDATPTFRVAGFNNSNSHEAVLAMFDKAIELSMRP